jgi:MFS transporter, ACS family, allantoate permease
MESKEHKGNPPFYESEKEKFDVVAVSAKEVDTAAELVAGDDTALDPAEALRIRSVLYSSQRATSYPPHEVCRRKIDLHILPLMCSTSSRFESIFCFLYL